MDTPNQICGKRSNRTKIADLERMRNNQRRSRAKRKAYVAELEEKIRRYETSESESATGHSIQYLMKENDTLRRLLLSMGLGNDFLAAYINASGVAGDMLKNAVQSDEQATLDDTNCCRTDRLPREQDTSASAPLAEKQALSPLETCLNIDAVDSNLLFQQGNQLISPRVVETISLEAPFDTSSYFGDIESTWQIQGPSPMTSIAAQGEDKVDTIEGSKIPWDDEDTTLCSVAFSLIMTSNRKGYSTADLDLKLRVGYRNTHATFEGCRIDNRTLIRVLTEIM